MSLNGPPAASRQFWAQSYSRAPSTPAPGQAKGINRNVVYGLVAAAVLGFPLVILVIAWDSGALGSGANSAFAGLGRILVGVIAVGGVLGVAGFFAFKQFKSMPQHRGTWIRVTSDVLTVDERPGMAYRLRGATLGTWGMGGGSGGASSRVP
jgi:hypothetical protein